MNFRFSLIVAVGLGIATVTALRMFVGRDGVDHSQPTQGVLDRETHQAPPEAHQARNAATPSGAKEIPAKSDRGEAEHSAPRALVDPYVDGTDHSHLNHGVVGHVPHHTTAEVLVASCR